MADSTPPDSLIGDPRPGLAMVVNANTPYRLHLHRRIAREIPELKLLSVFTHDVSNSPWVLNAPPEIGAVQFGLGEASAAASSNFASEWKKGGRIIDFLKRSGTRAVVLHGYNDAGRLRIFNWCYRTGVPCFIWGDSNVRSDFARGLTKTIKSAYLKYLLKRAAGVMPCGSLGRAFFESYGADPARVYYCPYEPDYQQIAALPEADIRDVASRFNLQPDRRRIVYSGRLVPQKRVDLLIHSFNTLAADRPEWDLVIVGDGPLKEELRALVKEDLKGRVNFIGFQGTQSVVSAIYRNSDLLCLPSEYEPWALVINEAAAAGLAIVSSDIVGASAELVRDGVNGKTFKNKDLDECTAALHFVTDPARIDSLRTGSAQVLADWRARGDPVDGLRNALVAAGVLTMMLA